MRKPAPPLLDKLATPQKNTLCSFHFACLPVGMARAGFLFLLMKRVFFCGVLPSKYSGRWRGCPQFDFAKEKRNFYPVASLLCFGVFQPPRPPCLRSTAGGQSASWRTPNPLPCLRRERRGRQAFCPPASGGGFAPKTFRRDGGTIFQFLKSIIQLTPKNSFYKVPFFQNSHKSFLFLHLQFPL